MDVELKKLSKSIDLCCLLDEMMIEHFINIDDQGFWATRNVVIQAFKDNYLYSLYDIDYTTINNQNYAKEWMGKISNGMLPAFCICRNHHIEMIWVAKRIRRMGYGSRMVNMLKCTSSSLQMEDSELFWESVGIEED
jgi:hypothetical protein